MIQNLMGKKKAAKDRINSDSNCNDTKSSRQSSAKSCTREDNGTREDETDKCGCNCPNGCVVGQPVDPDNPEDALKFDCSNAGCAEVPFIHSACYEVWEKLLIHASTHGSGCQRARYWTDSVTQHNLWLKKGYQLIFRYCECHCAHGHIRLDPDYKIKVSLLATAACSQGRVKTKHCSIASGSNGLVEVSGDTNNKKRKKKGKNKDLPPLVINNSRLKLHGNILGISGSEYTEKSVFSHHEQEKWKETIAQRNYEKELEEEERKKIREQELRNMESVQRQIEFQLGNDAWESILAHEARLSKDDRHKPTMSIMPHTSADTYHRILGSSPSPIITESIDVNKCIPSSMNDSQYYTKNSGLELSSNAIVKIAVDNKNPVVSNKIDKTNACKINPDFLVPTANCMRKILQQPSLQVGYSGCNIKNECIGESRCMAKLEHDFEHSRIKNNMTSEYTNSISSRFSNSINISSHYEGDNVYSRSESNNESNNNYISSVNSSINLTDTAERLINIPTKQHQWDCVSEDRQSTRVDPRYGCCYEQLRDHLTSDASLVSFGSNCTLDVSKSDVTNYMPNVTVSQCHASRDNPVTAFCPNSYLKSERPMLNANELGNNSFVMQNIHSQQYNPDGTPGFQDNVMCQHLPQMVPVVNQNQLYYSVFKKGVNDEFARPNNGFIAKTQSMDTVNTHDKQEQNCCNDHTNQNTITNNSTVNPNMIKSHSDTNMLQNAANKFHDSTVNCGEVSTILDSDLAIRNNPLNSFVQRDKQHLRYHNDDKSGYRFCNEFVTPTNVQTNINTMSRFRDCPYPSSTVGDIKNLGDSADEDIKFIEQLQNYAKLIPNRCLDMTSDYMQNIMKSTKPDVINRIRLAGGIAKYMQLHQVNVSSHNQYLAFPTETSGNCRTSQASSDGHPAVISDVREMLTSVSSSLTSSSSDSPVSISPFPNPTSLPPAGESANDELPTIGLVASGEFVGPICKQNLTSSTYDIPGHGHVMNFMAPYCYSRYAHEIENILKQLTCKSSNQKFGI